MFKVLIMVLVLTGIGGAESAMARAANGAKPAPHSVRNPAPRPDSSGPVFDLHSDV